jgi:hypothetical protein
LESLQNFLLYIIFRAVTQTRRFPWTADSRELLFSAFRARKEFPAEGYDILIAFLHGLFERYDTEDEQFQISQWVLELFEKSHHLIKVAGHDALLGELFQRITSFDHTALLILAHIASIRSDSPMTSGLLKDVPCAFAVRVEQQWRDFTADERDRIHNLPAIFEDNVPPFRQGIHRKSHH